MNRSIISDIISAEWAQFQQVYGENGRAPCQDNFLTFYIMRASQFLTWNKDLLEHYLLDLKTAKADNHNLIAEKYARMMSVTAPEKYAELKDMLPPVSEQKQSVVRSIVEIQLKWQRDFVQRYPKYASGGRKTEEADSASSGTSFETYLKSELLTYSLATLDCYLSLAKQLDADGMNMSIMNQEHCAKFYGFHSLQDAEEHS